MRKLLLGSPSRFNGGLFTAGLVVGVPILGAAGPASAEEPIRLTVGGYFKSAYQIVVDDNQAGENGVEPGFDRNTDGFFSDSEIHFTGSTLLDNGLEVGARVELEGETDEDQVDEAWVWFSGGFGEFRIGSDDEALANTCIMPPGGTANFSAFSPNQWGANSIESNTACTGVDALSDAQKILYITPVFYGFQLTTSYTPSQFAESHVNDGGPHLGMPLKFEQQSDYGVSAYLTYSYEGEDWGVTLGGGVSLESGTDTVSAGSTSIEVNDQDFYQAGLTVTLGNFAIGGAFEYMNDITNATLSDGTDSVHIEQDSWIAGGGVSYMHDAWTFGAQYSYREDDLTFFDFDLEHRQHHGVLTANYALGPGIDLDAEIGYTRVDTNNLGNVFFGDDNYDALEIGLGSSITF